MYDEDDEGVEKMEKIYAKGRSVQDLIDLLEVWKSLHGPGAQISVLGTDGIARTQICIQSFNIATELLSEGDEVVY